MVSARIKVHLASGKCLEIDCSYDMTVRDVEDDKVFSRP